MKHRGILGSRFSHVGIVALILTGACASSSDDSNAKPAASANADAGPAPTTGSNPPPPASTDSGPPAPTTVPMFVAIGHEGRTTISCDDGATWVANASDDDALKCFNPTDCDHNGHAGRGIAFVDGVFVANFGWGQPGTIRRSVDGVVWGKVDEGSNFASMVTGNGRTIAISGAPKISTDDGKTWTQGTAPGIGARRGGFGAKLFVMVDDGPKAVTSSDGMAWDAVTTLPTTCGKDIQWAGGIGEAGSAPSKVIVIASGDGVVCSSPDGGVQWTSTKIASGIGGRLVQLGGDVFVWGNTNEASPKPAMFRSSDGVTWTTHLTSLTGGGNANGPPIGPVAVSPKGTFVAANDGWQVWYEKQHFYRSADGIVWEDLAAGKFVGSHPITHMTWGEGAPSAICPLAL
jgi:hypothetical protein